MLFQIEKFFIINAQNYIKNFHQTELNMFELEVTKERLFEFLYFLKNYETLLFRQLTDITAYDRLSHESRFNLVYSFFSALNNFRINISLQLKEGEAVHSIIDLFEGASWIEREVWDLFGIFILNNNDFRRILCDYGFRGHPLRKDYPLSGYYEILFDEHYTQLNYFPVEFMQEYRAFELKNTWGPQEIL